MPYIKKNDLVNKEAIEARKLNREQLRRKIEEQIPLNSAEQRRWKELERARLKNAAALAARAPAMHLKLEDLEEIKKGRPLNSHEQAQEKYLKGLKKARENLKKRQGGAKDLKREALARMIARGEVLTDAQNLRWKLLQRDQNRRRNFKKVIPEEVLAAKKLTAAKLEEEQKKRELNNAEKNRLFRLKQKKDYTQARRAKEKIIGPPTEEWALAWALNTQELRAIKEKRPLNPSEQARWNHLYANKTKQQRAAKELNYKQLRELEKQGPLNPDQEKRLKYLLEHQIAARKRRATQKEKKIEAKKFLINNINRKILLKIPLTRNEERYLNKYNKKLKERNKAKKIASPPKSTKNRKLVRTKNNVRKNYKKFKRLASQRNPHHCAVCNVETKHFLELAHIVPFYQKQYTTDPDNCLFLCPIHHKCFDSFYFIIKKNGIVIINSYIIDFDSGSNAILNIRKKIKLTKKQSKFFKLQNELRSNKIQKILAEITANINNSNNSNQTITPKQIQSQKYRIKFFKQRLALFKKITASNKTNNKTVLMLKPLLKNLNLENLKLLNSIPEFQQIITETLNGMTEKEYLSHIKFLRSLGISFSRTQLWIEKYLFTFRKELLLNKLEMNAQSNSESNSEDEELDELPQVPSWQIRGNFTDKQIKARAKIINQQESCCTFCGLDASDLLEAAHIVPFKHARNKSMKIANFLPLCMNHHRCFDRNYLIFTEDGLGNWIININFYEANSIFDGLFHQITLTHEQDSLLRRRKENQEKDALEYYEKVLKSKKLTKEQRQELGKMFLEENTSSSFNIPNLNDIWHLSYNQLKANNEFQSFFKNINELIKNKNFFLRKMRIKRAIGRQLSQEEMILEFYITKELEEKNRTFNPEERDSISERNLADRVSINQNQYSEQAGDCFYQAILAHNNIPQLRNLTVYQLRQICIDYFNDNLTTPAFREKIGVMLRNILREREYAGNDTQVSPQNQDFLSWIPSDWTTKNLTDENLDWLINTYFRYYRSSKENHIWGRSEIEGEILIGHFRSKLNLPPEFNIYLLERQSFAGTNGSVYSISTIGVPSIVEDVNLNSGNIFIINTGNNHFERFNPELHNITTAVTFDGNVVAIEYEVSNEMLIDTSPEWLHPYNIIFEPHSSDEEGELIGDSFYQVLLENEQLKDLTVYQLRQICIDYFQDNMNNQHFRTNISNMLIKLLINKEEMEESNYINEFLNSLPFDWNLDSLDNEVKLDLLTKEYIKHYILYSGWTRIPGNSDIEGAILLNHFRDKLGLGENFRIYVMRRESFSSDEADIYFISLLGQDRVLSEQFINADEDMIIVQTPDGFQCFNPNNPEHQREVFNLNGEPVRLRSQLPPQVRATTSVAIPTPVFGSTLNPFTFNEQRQTLSETWAFHNPETSPISSADSIYSSDEEEVEDEEVLTFDEAIKEIRDNDDEDDNAGNNKRPTSNSEANTNSSSATSNFNSNSNNSQNSNQTNSSSTNNKTIGYYLFSFRKGKLRFEYICNHPNREAFISELSKKKGKSKDWESFPYFETIEETGKYLNKWVKEEYPKGIQKLVNNVFGFASSILDSSTAGSGSNTTRNNNSSGNEGKLSAVLAGIAADNYWYNQTRMEQKREEHYAKEERIKAERREQGKQPSHWERKADQTAEQCLNIANAMKQETGLFRHQMTNPAEWETSRRSYQSATDNNFKAKLEDSNASTKLQVSNERLLEQTTPISIPEQVESVSNSSNRIPVAEVRVKDNVKKPSTSQPKGKKSNASGNSFSAVPVGSNIHTLSLVNESVNTIHVVVGENGAAYTTGNGYHGQSIINNSISDNSYPQPTRRVILRLREDQVRQGQQQTQSTSSTFVPRPPTSGRGNNAIRIRREEELAAQRRERLVHLPEYNPNQSSGPSGTGTAPTRAIRQFDLFISQRRETQLDRLRNREESISTSPSIIQDSLSISTIRSNRVLSLIASTVRARQAQQQTQPTSEEYSPSMQ